MGARRSARPRRPLTRSADRRGLLRKWRRALDRALLRRTVDVILCLVKFHTPSPITRLSSRFRDENNFCNRAIKYRAHFLIFGCSFF
jgi:hypothetical protein